MSQLPVSVRIAPDRQGSQHQPPSFKLSRKELEALRQGISHTPFNKCQHLTTKPLIRTNGYQKTSLRVQDLNYLGSNIGSKALTNPQNPEESSSLLKLQDKYAATYQRPAKYRYSKVWQLSSYKKVPQLQMQTAQLRSNFQRTLQQRYRCTSQGKGLIVKNKCTVVRFEVCQALKYSKSLTYLNQYRTPAKNSQKQQSIMLNVGPYVAQVQPSFVQKSQQSQNKPQYNYYSIEMLRSGNFSFLTKMDSMHKNYGMPALSTQAGFQKQYKKYCQLYKPKLPGLRLEFGSEKPKSKQQNLKQYLSLFNPRLLSYKGEFLTYNSLLTKEMLGHFK